MKSRLKRAIKEMTLLTKLRLVILSIVLLLCIVFILISYFFHKTITSKQQSNFLKGTSNYAADNLSMNLKDIMERFTIICARQDFQDIVTNVKLFPKQYKSNRYNLQDTLQDLTDSHYLVENAAIVDSNSQIYTLYSNTATKEAHEIIKRINLSNLSGVQVLSSCKIELSQTEYLPFVISLSLKNQMPMVTNFAEEVDDYIILFVNKNKLNHAIHNVVYQNNDSKFYLYQNETNQFIDLNRQNELIVSNRDREIFHDLHQQTYTYPKSLVSSDSAEALYTMKQLETVNYSFVMISETQSFWDILGESRLTLLIIVLISLILLNSVSYFASNYVSKPIRKLLAVVQKIESGTYTEKVEFLTNDEVGQLMHAINSMHEKIEEQILMIKTQESKKLDAELRLLSEQINPHFLYNTLGVIQSEIRTDKKDIAVNMLQSLTSYLRIGLSSGANDITIRQEISHVQAYVDIMNQRFGQQVNFTYRILPDLLDCKIIKIILQPIVENSFKHGFGIDQTIPATFSPEIEVEFDKEKLSNLSISIHDNGSGFDVDELQKYFTDKVNIDSNEHFGLTNILQRMYLQYGSENVHIYFSSIPYFRNTIKIVIEHFFLHREEDGGEIDHQQ